MAIDWSKYTNNQTAKKTTSGIDWSKFVAPKSAIEKAREAGVGQMSLAGRIPTEAEFQDIEQQSQMSLAFPRESYRTTAPEKRMTTAPKGIPVNLQTGNKTTGEKFSDWLIGKISKKTNLLERQIPFLSIILDKSEEKVNSGKNNIVDNFLVGIFRSSRKVNLGKDISKIFPKIEYNETKKTALTAITEKGIYGIVPFKASIEDLKRNYEVYSASTRMKEGRATPEDLFTLKQVLDDAQKTNTLGYGITLVVRDMIPFAGELFFTSGIYNFGRQLTTKVVGKTLEKVASKELAQSFIKVSSEKITQEMAKNAIKLAPRLLAKTITGIGGGIIRTPFYGVAKIPSDAIKNLIPEYHFTQDELGNLNYVIDKNGDNFLKAYAKSSLSGFIESASEMSGGLFKYASKPVMSKIGQLAFVKSFLRINQKATTSTFGKILESLHWDGVFNEMLEERVADVSYGLLNKIGLSDQELKFPSKQQLLTELISFSIPGVALSYSNYKQKSYDDSLKKVLEQIQEDYINIFGSSKIISLEGIKKELALQKAESFKLKNLSPDEQENYINNQRDFVADNLDRAIETAHNKINESLSPDKGGFYMDIWGELNDLKDLVEKGKDKQSDILNGLESMKLLGMDTEVSTESYKIDTSETALIEEAKKYKTAEEFVKAQNAYKIFSEKYNVSGVKKEIQREALDSFQKQGRQLANTIADELGYRNIDEIPEFGVRNLLRNLYDPNYFDKNLTFEKIINRLKNTTTDVKIKSQLTDIWNKAQEETSYKIQEEQLTTKILSKLEGRETVSKQFISDLTNSGDLKQVEKDLIREVLTTEGDVVNVANFSNKVRNELLPLKLANPFASENELGGKYENISLPDEVRGNVANYYEHIWESPIKTSAGDVHFQDVTENYFGHTRVEDMANNTYTMKEMFEGKAPKKAKFIDVKSEGIIKQGTLGDTRRIIEVQSDLYQKGHMEDIRTGLRKTVSESKTPVPLAEKKLAGYNKLAQYNDPTAHFRMVREEVKLAAKDGKTKLQFPTGETAMKIEGLGEQNVDFFNNKGIKVRISDIVLGAEIHKRGLRNDKWTIVEILDEPGKFKMIPNQSMISEEKYNEYLNNQFEENKKDFEGDFIKFNNKYYHKNFSESFDIFGRIDTNNPIYRFYEKDLARYLKSKYNAQLVTDNKGVTWFEVDIKSEMATQPVEAFKVSDKKYPFNTTVEKMKEFYDDMFGDSVLFETSSRITTPQGFNALGSSLNGIVKMVEQGGLVNDKVGYHEAFHTFLNDFIKSERKSAIVDYVKKNYSKELEVYKEYETDNKKAEEFIADKFAEFIKNKETKYTGLKGFFRQILDFVKNVISNKNEFNDLFGMAENLQKFIQETEEYKKLTVYDVEKIKNGENKFKLLHSTARSGDYSDADMWFDIDEGGFATQIFDMQGGDLGWYNVDSKNTLAVEDTEDAINKLFGKNSEILKDYQSGGGFFADETMMMIDNDITTEARKQGYDLIFFKERGHGGTEVVLLKPNQAKLVSIRREGEDDFTIPKKSEINVKKTSKRIENAFYGIIVYKNLEGTPEEVIKRYNLTKKDLKDLERKGEWFKNADNYNDEEKKEIFDFNEKLKKAILNKTSYKISSTQINKITGKELPPFIKQRETTILKNRIRNIIKGFREGRTFTKQEIFKTQTEILDILKESNLDLNDKAKFIATIKNIQTQEQLQIQLPVIENRILALEESSEIRKLKFQIRKELAQTKTQKQTGKIIGKYTPELQKILNQMRESVNLTQNQATEKIYNNLERYKDTLMPDEVAQENRILQMITGDQSIENLQSILSDIKEMKETGDIAVSLKEFNRQAEIQQNVDAAIQTISGGEGLPADISTIGSKRPKTKNLSQRFKNWISGTGKGVVGWKDLLDMLSFKDLTTERNESFLNRFGDVLSEKNAEKTLNRNDVMQFRELIQDSYNIKKDKDIRNTLNDLNEEFELGTFKREDGVETTLKMTRDEAIKRYMEFQDPTLNESFEYGNKYTQQMKEAIIGILTDGDIKFAEAQLNWYQDKYEQINEIYRDIYGIDLGYNPFYSPIQREGISSEDIIGFGEFLQESYIRQSTAPGGLKARVENLKPIKIQSSTIAIQKHSAEMNHFITWAKKMKDLRSVFGNEQVKSAVQYYHGDKMLKYIESFLTDFTRGGVSTASNLDVLDRFRGRFTQSVLYAKPSIGVKQLTSFITYADEIPIKNFVNGIKDWAINPKVKTKFLLENSELLKSRGLNLERDLETAMKTDKYRNFKAHPGWFNSLGIMIEIGDKGAIVMGGWSVYKYHYDNAISQGKSQTEAIKIGINEFEKATESTQQSADISELSYWQRGGSWAKLFSMFQSAPNQYFRKELSAFRNLFAGRISPVKFAKTIAIYHIILPVFFQMVTNLFRWDEESKKEYLRASILGAFNGIFIAGDLLNGLLAILMRLKDWGSEIPIQTITDDFKKGIKHLQTENLELEDVLEAVKDFSTGGGIIAGWPIKQIIQDFDAGADILDGEYYKGLAKFLGWSEYMIGGTEKTGGGTGKRKTLKKVNFPRHVRFTNDRRIR